MRMLRFSRLCLLSQHERRAFSVNVSSEATVLQAGNGFGKSAVLKSLYNAFGAEPHRIDPPGAAPTSKHCLSSPSMGCPTSSSLDVAPMRYLTPTAIFNFAQLRTTSVSKYLTDYLAKLLDFQLEMLDRKEEAITPPPSYMFAPFYIDQDASWDRPWASFQRFYLSNSSKTLAEYHSGLKPNEYYAGATAMEAEA